MAFVAFVAGAWDLLVMDAMAYKALELSALNCLGPAYDTLGASMLSCVTDLAASRSRFVTPLHVYTWCFD